MSTGSRPFGWWSKGPYNIKDREEEERYRSGLSGFGHRGNHTCPEFGPANPQPINDSGD